MYTAVNSTIEPSEKEIAQSLANGDASPHRTHYYVWTNDRLDPHTARVKKQFQRHSQRVLPSAAVPNIETVITALYETYQSYLRKIPYTVSAKSRRLPPGAVTDYLIAARGRRALRFGNSLLDGALMQNLRDDVCAPSGDAISSKDGSVVRAARCIGRKVCEDGWSTLLRRVDAKTVYSHDVTCSRGGQGAGKPDTASGVVECGETHFE
ncbi:hypothetical protein EVAR_46125_1 [Eumeta japonica]|uniref:Uncharacterized protein n=1 Tax=Eumeta variegata TaxID=151549 RepID=A0A4C1XTT7_EUMVA|nr:hypothetical protein EVAR_46125_1 [Eumeta japonica]